MHSVFFCNPVILRPARANRRCEKVQTAATHAGFILLQMSNKMPAQCDGRRGILARASCTRLSPKSCWPASDASRTRTASCVFEIATSSIASGVRALFSAAAAICARTRSRFSAMLMHLNAGVRDIWVCTRLACWLQVTHQKRTFPGLPQGKLSRNRTRHLFSANKILTTFPRAVRLDRPAARRPRSLPGCAWQGNYESIIRETAFERKSSTVERVNFGDARSRPACRAIGSHLAGAPIESSGNSSALSAVPYSTPTAREMRRITILNEMEIWIIAKILAQRASNGASVGPKVELWVKATKR